MLYNTIHVSTYFIVCNLTVYIVFVDILSFCSLSFLFCLFRLPYHSSSMCFDFVIFSVINYMYHIGGTIATIASLNVLCLTIQLLIIVVRQPSGYMVLAFH